jgi:hypothetical protein
MNSQNQNNQIENYVSLININLKHLQAYPHRGLALH